MNPATGETAVGAGGGIVEAPGGVELRIPEGALDEGVVLKLESLGLQARLTALGRSRRVSL